MGLFRKKKICACCGTPLDGKQRAVDFAGPEDIVRLSIARRASVLKIWTEMMVVADGYDTAIKALLPVQLDDGYSITFGVWLGLPDPVEAQRVVSAGANGGAGWVGCTFTGLVRNTIPPWSGLLGATATAVAPGPSMVARIVDSDTPALKQVLEGTWPHREVFAARSFR